MSFHLQMTQIDERRWSEEKEDLIPWGSALRMSLQYFDEPSRFPPIKRNLTWTRTEQSQILLLSRAWPISRFTSNIHCRRRIIVPRWGQKEWMLLQALEDCLQAWYHLLSAKRHTWKQIWNSRVTKEKVWPYQKHHEARCYHLMMP